MNNTTDKRVRDNLPGNFQIAYEIFHGFTIKAGYAQDQANGNNSFSTFKQRDSVNIDRSFSHFTNSRTEKTTSSGLHFTKNLNLHQIDFSLDFNNYQSSEEYNRQDSSFSLNNKNYLVYYSDSDLHYTSYSLYFDYNYLKKYYFNANLTAETSNTYILYIHPDKNLFYPSISAAWLISNEDF